MHLLVIHGSPRGHNPSNGALLATSFTSGFRSAFGHTSEDLALAPKREYAAIAKRFAEAERVLIVMPLYTDSMPAIVKEWLEHLPEALAATSHRPRVLFLLHSGFPEAIHCRVLERYCARLAARLGCPLDGIMVKPASEGIAIQPAWMRRSFERILWNLGAGYAKDETLDPQLVKKLAGVERYRGLGRLALYLGSWFASYYWNSRLRKNGAFARSFARPLQVESRT